MRELTRYLGLACGASLLFGCGSVEPITACEDGADMRVICGLQNPEDLVSLPGRADQLLVSEMGTMDGGVPGEIALVGLSDGRRRPLFPAAGSGKEPAPGQLDPLPGWGDERCPGPPDARFSPHGIDLARRVDGRQQLLVVNHGGREAVEIFELLAGDPPELVWRGCVEPAPDAFLNDVVALPDGGFAVTHMAPRGALRSTFALVLGLFGADTGHVFEWSPESGVRVVEGSSAPMPNGIEVSPDGAFLYVNVYLGDQVRRIPRSGEGPVRVAAVKHPDNVTWSHDGRRLLIASHPGGMSDTMGCAGIEGGSCPAAFAIVEVEPDTMRTRTLLEHRGAPMGAATVALDTGTALIFGSFAGDRIAIRDNPAGD